MQYGYSSSLLHSMGGLLNICSFPLDGLLNSSVARLSKLGLIGDDLFCNKDIYIYIYIYNFAVCFRGSFEKFNVCFCLSIALMTIGR